jgi:type IV secretory pathway VirJ component
MSKTTYYFLFFALACGTITAHSQDTSAKLPIEVLSSANERDVLILYITGDGGWNRFSEEVGHSFVKNGYSVIAFNARKYFWDAKTPQIFARDIEMLALHYLKVLKKTSLIIVGYSFGADVAAFLPNYLTKNLIAKIRLLALLSPSASTNFEIQLSDLITGGDSKDRKYLVSTELDRSIVPVLCLFGSDEDLILKKELRPGARIRIEELPGSHRYNQKSELLVEHVLRRLLNQ